MSTDDDLYETISKAELNRRSFLKWSAAIGGSTALIGSVPEGFKQMVPLAHAEEKGRWIPASCWHDCGSKGFNKAYVVDGLPVKQGTDETIKDSPNCPQLRACAKGRSQRNHLLSAGRLKYPMKRKHWKPGGGNKELRGKDEWVRISWDEALDLMATEMLRIKEEHGNKAVLCVRPGEPTERLMSEFGGYVNGWGEHSGGTFSAAWHMGWGIPFSELENDRLDLENTELFVLWASNPAWSRAGIPMYDLSRYKRNGAKVIVVDPFYNATAQTIADEWIPCRPATDTAMLLAMSYVLIDEDDPQNDPLIDWDFLHKYTVGFDKDHMPKGANIEENYMDYVLGTYDGQPKTPEWASEICGTPPEQIRYLARRIATTNKVAFRMSPAPARVHNADSLPQVVMTLGAMTGHMGKSGEMFGHDWGHAFLAEGYPLLIGGWMLTPTSYVNGKPFENPLASGFKGYFGAFWRNKQFEDENVWLINYNELWHALNVGEYTVGKGKKRKVDIKMIYHVYNNKMNQFPGTLESIEVHRKVDFVVTQNLFLNPTAQYSDLVLPVQSHWEKYGYVRMGYRNQILWTSQVMEPYFESKSDSWICRELGKRLGLDPDKIIHCSFKQNVFDHVANCKVIKNDGSGYEPLVTITEKDMKDFGFEGTPQKGRISLREFKEKGIYHIERQKGDQFEHIPYKSFIENPEKNPRKTPSGKFEIHCQSYADYITNCGWDEKSPLAKYVPPLEGYESTFKDWKNKIKGDYPLQQYDLHVLRRVHSTLDNTPWLQEAFLQSFWMNPIDADKRHIKNGETVLISSKYGKVLRNATVTQFIMPGVVAIAQGAWVNIDEKTGIDRGGCPNVLHGSVSTGQGHMGLNSCNVQVEKWKGEPLKYDYQLPPLVPIKEA